MNGRPRRNAVRHILINGNLKHQRRIQHLIRIGCLKSNRLRGRSLNACHVLMGIIPISPIHHIKLMQIHGVLAILNIILRQELSPAFQSLQLVIPGTHIASAGSRIAQAVIHRPIAIRRIGSDIKEIINSPKTRIGSAGQRRAGTALLHQNAGRQIKGADVTVIRRLHNCFRKSIRLTVIAGKNTSIHKRTVDNALDSCNRMGVPVIGKGFKLKNSRMIQEISGIHKISNRFSGSTDPCFTVIACPGLSDRIIGAFLIRFPGIWNRIIDKIAAQNAFFSYRRIPVKPRMLSDKNPIGIFLVQAAQAAPVAFRKSLLIQQSFKLHIRWSINPGIAFNPDILRVDISGHTVIGLNLIPGDSFGVGFHAQHGNFLIWLKRTHNIVIDSRSAAHI